MPKESKKLVGVVYSDRGGKQARYLSEYHTIRFVIQNFTTRNDCRHRYLSSDPMECHGTQWKVKVSSGEEQIGFYLQPENVRSLMGEVNFDIRVVSSCSADKVRSINGLKFTKSGSAKGFDEFISRKEVLESSNGYLSDGDLIVEVDIRVQNLSPVTWKPNLTDALSTDMLKILDSANADGECKGSGAAIVFQIGRGQNTEGSGGIEMFYAHRAILSTRAPLLAALAEEQDEQEGDAGKPIPIEDMEPEMFRMLLRYVYGGEVPDYQTLKNDACTLIRVADRFSCTGLKLAAEAEMAAAGITAANCADMILFSDATNCALLKETAIDYFVKNSTKVKETSGYEKITESRDVMEELMNAALTDIENSNKKRSVDDHLYSETYYNRDYKRMRVTELLTTLAKYKLDCHGSKEMLISRLEESEEKILEIEDARVAAILEAAGI